MKTFSQRPHFLRLWILVCFFHFSGLNNSYCYEFSAAALNLRDSVSFAGWMVDNGLAFFSLRYFTRFVEQGRRIALDWSCQLRNLTLDRRGDASRAGGPLFKDGTGGSGFKYPRSASTSYQWSYQEQSRKQEHFREFIRSLRQAADSRGLSRNIFPVDMLYGLRSKINPSVRPVARGPAIRERTGTRLSFSKEDDPSAAIPRHLGVC